MTLQGPHQVAKQSMTIRPGLPTASLKSLMLWEEVFVSFCSECLEGGLCGRRGESKGVFNHESDSHASDAMILTGHAQWAELTS